MRASARPSQRIASVGRTSRYRRMRNVIPTRLTRFASAAAGVGGRPIAVASAHAERMLTGFVERDDGDFSIGAIASRIAGDVAEAATVPDVARDPLEIRPRS